MGKRPIREIRRQDTIWCERRKWTSWRYHGNTMSGHFKPKIMNKKSTHDGITVRHPRHQDIDPCFLGRHRPQIVSRFWETKGASGTLRRTFGGDGRIWWLYFYLTVSNKARRPPCYPSSSSSLRPSRSSSSRSSSSSSKNAPSSPTTTSSPSPVEKKSQMQETSDNWGLQDFSCRWLQHNNIQQVQNAVFCFFFNLDITVYIS